MDDPGSKRFNERLWRKQRNEKLTEETTMKSKESGLKKFDSQVSFLHSDNNPGTILIFHTFETQIVGADRFDGVM